MSDEFKKAARKERRRREERERDLRPEREICLHCGNPFDAGNGVVTADAAICDICIDG